MHSVMHTAMSSFLSAIFLAQVVHGLEESLKRVLDLLMSLWAIEPLDLFLSEDCYFESCALLIHTFCFDMYYQTHIEQMYLSRVLSDGAFNSMRP